MKIKTIFCSLILSLLFPVMVFAASNITFAWDYVAVQDLAGFKIYQSNISGQYSDPAVLTIPSTSNPIVLTDTLTNIQDGTWFWIIRAFDNNGNESANSNEVTATLDTQAPPVPSGFTITIIIKVQ